MIDQEKIHNQCFSEDPKERIKALEQLKDNFSLLPDKEQAWNDLIKLTTDEDCSVRRIAVKSLCPVFPHVPNTQQAWSDLHRLLNDENSSVRRGATIVLISLFSQLPDKQQAWEDLHSLLNDEDNSVRFVAINVLRFSFSQLPDKHQAWNDLHTLLNYGDRDLRGCVANNLSSVFIQLPDKQQAWEDLHKLAKDEDSSIRRDAAKCFGSPFSQFPNKQQAWNDLHRLTNDENSDVRFYAAHALGPAFIHVPDKQQAWDDLHRLTNDDSNVRCGAALALGSAFSYIPYKERTFETLCRLTTDEDWIVRSYANHSLGKISILKASQAQSEEDYRKELERAIEFFEKAPEKSPSLSISQFCLPFYRSFYTIIFKKQQAKEEVDKYLEEAKSAIEGSKSKELLFEAVKNLAEALREVQDMGNLDFEAKKCELDFYRKYCDRAADLMRDTEETAPFATIAIRKGLPILDRNLKGLIEETQKRSRIACKESKGTDAEAIVCEINKEIQNAISDDQKQYVEIFEDIVSILKIKIPSIPENKLILSKIEAVDNKIVSPEKYQDLPLIISIMPTMKVVSEQELDHKLLKLDFIYDKTVSIEAKLDLIQKELDRGIEKLDILSMEIGGKEGELIKTFSKKILELTEKGDKEALKNFLEEILKNEDSLIKEVENSSVPLEEKIESKSSVSKIRSVLDKIKHPIKSFGKDVTNEIIVGYAAEEIVKLVFQLVSMATLGVPIPPQIMILLRSVAKEIKK